jgi:hypothetical protein
MTQKFSTKTPIKLQDAVYAAFAREYQQLIDEHGASYAVNVALAFHLRRRGHAIPELETPAERIAKGQAKRWKSIKAVDAEADAKAEARREMKRERDRRHRAKKRAEKAAQSSTPEE